MITPVPAGRSALFAHPVFGHDFIHTFGDTYDHCVFVVADADGMRRALVATNATATIMSLRVMRVMSGS
jgi:hypothetical protein